MIVWNYRNKRGQECDVLFIASERLQETSRDPDNGRINNSAIVGRRQVEPGGQNQES